MNYYLIYDVLYPLLLINVCLGYHLLIIVKSSDLNTLGVTKENPLSTPTLKTSDLALYLQLKRAIVRHNINKQIQRI